MTADDLMLPDGGIEWGDPLPRSPKYELDPELVDLLGRGVRVIIPEMIEETRAKVHLRSTMGCSCYWIVRMRGGGHALLTTSLVGTLNQINIAPDTQSILLAVGDRMSTSCKEEIARQLLGESPYGSDPRPALVTTGVTTPSQRNIFEEILLAAQNDVRSSVGFHTGIDEEVEAVTENSDDL